MVEMRSLFENLVGGLLLNIESQFCSKACSTQHAHWVLLIALFGIADDTQHAVLNIFVGVGVIEQRAITDVVIEGVCSEITSNRILRKRAVYIVP